MVDTKTIGPTQIRIVSERTDQFLEDIRNRASDRMARAIAQLEENMINTLQKIQVNTNGRIEGLKVNLKQTQAIHKQMLAEFESTYGVAAREIVDGFDGVSDLIENSWNYLGESANFTSIDHQIIKTLKNQSFQQFAQFGSQAQTRITDAMYSHVVGGGSYASLLNTVRGVLRGQTDIRGNSMLRYANQYAFDSVMNFHNQVNLQKAEDLGINHYLYVGDIMGTSRQFCRRRAGKVYTRGQINSWTQPWQGKAGPAFEYRGGYNCRHHWRPVRPEWLNGKTQLDIGDWNVGGDIQAKPKFLTGGAGIRGWNDFTKDERKILSNLQRRTKQGVTLTSGQKGVKFWNNNLNQAERDAFIAAYEKEGITVPDILKKRVGPKPIVPTPTPQPPVIKPTTVTPPKPTVPAPAPAPKPPGARTWEKLTKDEQKLATGLRRTIIKNPDKIKPNMPRVKKWNEIPEADRTMIIQRWEAEGLDVPAALKANVKTVVPQPMATPAPAPVQPTVPVKKAAKGDWQALKKELNDLEKTINGGEAFSVRQAAAERLSSARKEFALVAPSAEVKALRKKVWKEMMLDTGNSKATRMINNLEEGTKHLPFEFIQDLKDDGVKVFLDRGTGASWNVNNKILRFSSDQHYFMNPSAVAHEVSHALDYRMGARAGEQFHPNAGMWKTSSKIPVTDEDGRQYRQWFIHQQSGRRGTSYNGNIPYSYHIGNFIDSYEGRIYNRGIGQEFWSMGNERYFDGVQKAGKLLDFGSQSVDRFRFNLDKAKRGFRIPNAEKKWMQHKQRAAKAMLGDIDAEDFLEGYLSDPVGSAFAAQSNTYPEYAAWMKDFHRNWRASTRAFEIEDLTDFVVKDANKNLIKEIAEMDLTEVLK